MPGLFDTKWGKALQERIEAKKAKREKKDEVRGKKRTARKTSRDAIKKIRAGEGTKQDKRRHIGAVKAFHRTDKEGKSGGMAAFGKYSAKVGAKDKRKAAVKKRVADRRAARKNR